MKSLERAVDDGDLDELVRWVDRLCEQRDWDALVRLRALCRAALERGRQLWPAASFAEYRLALEAPAPFAATMLVPGTGRFALGPLSEVAASSHPWADLAPHASPGPVASLAAHERVVRGEVVDPATLAVAGLELPLELAPWEPTYAVATYHPDRVDAPRPPSPARTLVPRSAHRGKAPPAGPDDATATLVALVRTWVESSNGRAESTAVAGSAHDAIAALGVAEPRVAELDLADALGLMVWAAATGGAHGPRRGAAIGRFDAWWALAALTGLDDGAWPPDAAELGTAGAELRFFEWDAGEPDTGWVLRLAVEDPGDGLAWVLAATDAV